jgi:hypothetical protein
VLPRRINNEHLAIQVQERVEAVVADPVTDLLMLSLSDNSVKRFLELSEKNLSEVNAAKLYDDLIYQVALRASRSER